MKPINPDVTPRVIKPTETSIQNAPTEVIIINEPISVLAATVLPILGSLNFIYTPSEPDDSILVGNYPRTGQT